MAHADVAVIRKRPRRVRRTMRRVRQQVSVALLALLFLFPLLVMLSTAFKTPGDVFSSPPSLLPTDWTLDNFAEAFDQIPVWRYLGNTLFVSGMSILGTVISCPLVAYALAKVRWRGSRPLLILVLATMMLPPQVTLIPLFLVWNGLEATNTYLPLIVPAFLGTPFFIFMIRQFLLAVPDELIEAARLDGASEFRTYATIVLPLARPAIVTAAIFQFVWAWTDFLNPLIYLNDESTYTLSIGLYAFFGENDVAWGPLMAACVMFTLPAVVIFLIGQKFFIGGASAGALK
ncbi:carbohydrate ABC transporter permease [Microbacterium sp. ISL-59]|jgi:multiple sugar transport system permease protein|uniref:carbohydrate ABC transporter permease n=1 Tax=Microbacterium sp. ISL-59 TaxID=2819159 RepID=UPI001BE81F96|nr:carbohydrate ABC transporter permease [Microbacterium sp. ISL-59]MBT2495666.1 carbohydrate ABC transporter permease [Microbacterium sp. ISL-59]